MIVSGPDTIQAQLIAKQLSSGAIRLATLNGGEQVLLSSTPITLTPIGEKEAQKMLDHVLQVPTYTVGQESKKKVAAKKLVK